MLAIKSYINVTIRKRNIINYITKIALGGLLEGVAVIYFVLKKNKQCNKYFSIPDKHACAQEHGNSANARVPCSVSSFM